MPRTYRRIPGSRKYADYTADVLEKCLNDIRAKRLSHRQASKKYGIPRSTIQIKLKNHHPKKVGRQTVFSASEEECFVQHLMSLADFGFPLGPYDFRMFIKNYLDKQGRTEKRFVNNLPGPDFIESFQRRHPELSVRFSTNVKRARIAVSEKVLSEYIDRLKTELETANISPSRIFNYDETNLQDDPGRKRVICRRGAKYIERYCNQSKSSTSVMFCGNASGTKFLPPYVVYRSDCLWDTWQLGGPKGTRYNRTKSGWFDSRCFEDWFEFHFLKAVKDETEPIALIGDNLSSHITPHVLKLCVQHRIRFICLPPNATHLCQPLDVAVYRPLKIYWKRVLSDWKESPEGQTNSTLPKIMFPILLKRVCDQLKGTIKSSLISGFRKCGIYPMSKDELLQRLKAKRENVDINYVGERFLEVLEEKRGKATKVKNVKKKRLMFHQVPE